jgi:RNA polymerase sigma factor (sigma-70 family)
MRTLLENQLILKCKNGDKIAFGKLIGSYKNQLFTYLFRFCGNKELAEDLLQDTLTKTWKAIPRYEEKNKFSSWLFSIAHNIALDSYRKRKVREIVSTFDELPDTSQFVNQQTEIEAEELKQIIMKSLNQLSEKQKNVFLLRQHSGMSFKEIAKVTNQPLNTVLSHMNYATKKLRKILSDKNVI